MCYSVASKIFIYSLLKFWPQFLLQITDAAWSHCSFAKYILYRIFINTRGRFKLQYEIREALVRRKIWNMPVKCSGVPATSLFIILKIACWPFFQPSLLSSCSKYRNSESKSPEAGGVLWKKECSRGNSPGIHAYMMWLRLSWVRWAEVKWNGKKNL